MVFDEVCYLFRFGTALLVASHRFRSPVFLGAAKDVGPGMFDLAGM
jgi:hypothetical protein